MTTPEIFGIVVLSAILIFIIGVMWLSDDES